MSWKGEAYMKRHLLTGLGLLALAGGTLILGAGNVQAQEEKNPLLNVAPDEMKTHVVKILRTSNKAQINRYVGRVYDFENVNPGAVNNYFHSALEAEEGAAYTFVGPDGASGKIMVICPEYQLSYFDTLVGSLDRSEITSAPGSKYLYKQLKHRSAADPDFLAVMRQYASANSVVLGDTETNAVFCWDSPSGGEHFETNLDEFLDLPTPVVKTTVKIYEVNLTNDGRIGLDYHDFKNGPWQNMVVGTYNNSDLNAHSSNGSSLDRTIRNKSYIVNLQLPSAYIDFLVEKGKARVVTESEIITSNRQPGSIYTGEQVLYYQKDEDYKTYKRTVTAETTSRAMEGDIRGNINAGGIVVGAIDTGVKLNVTPIIGKEAIELNIETSVVSLMGFQETGEPILNSRRAQTIVTVKDGEQITLGGMTRERQGDNSYKMPFLGDLPVLGYMFGGQADSITKTMLVMIVQPTIDNTFSNMDEKAEDIIAVTTREKDPEIPAAAYGFDMYLLDSEK